MPLVYRNVVPNVPALTAGNDRLCHSPNGRLVYSRAPVFSATWNGDIDLRTYVAEMAARGLHTDHSGIISATDINATIGVLRRGRAYGEMPVRGYAVGGQTVDAFLAAEISAEVYDQDGIFILGISMRAVVQWDDGYAGWRWMLVPYSGIEFNFPFDDGMGHGGWLVDDTHPAVYAQNLNTTDIRAGNGQLIPFVSCDTSDAWRLPALTGTSIYITSN